MPYILPAVVKLDDKLESFLADISILTEKVYNISIYLGYKRCMARLWEKEDICKPDINKRCLNKTLVDYDLCRLHTAKEGSVKWCGRVTEYPDNIKIIACYRKRLKKHNIMISDKEILNKITLNHQLDYNERKLCVVSNADCINKPLLNLKKDIILKIKIVYNSRMHTTVSDKLSYQNDFADTLHLYNITKDEYNDKLRQYINNLDYDSIQNDLFDKSGSTSLAKKFLNVVDIMQPTRRECNYVAIEIATAIRQNKLTESLRKTTSELNQSIIKKDIYSLESINKKYGLKIPYSGCSTHPHNMYFELLSETGIVGFILFFILIFFIIFKPYFKNINYIKNKQDVIFVLSIIFCIMFPFRPTGSFSGTIPSSNLWFFIGFYLYFINNLKYKK